MKKIILLSSIVAILSSCGSSGNGELVGVQERQFWNPTVYSKQGIYSDQNINRHQTKMYIRKLRNGLAPSIRARLKKKEWITSVIRSQESTA